MFCFNLFKIHLFLFRSFQLADYQPHCENETMVPVLTSKKASELPVNEAACALQVCVTLFDIFFKRDDVLNC